MSKSLFIAEKPSVAREFASALKEKFVRNNGFMESEHYVVTWCIGHLITMSYPEEYDISLKKWSFATLPFIPEHYKYEVIQNTKVQFDIVSRQLTRPDVDVIYVCTDSGREGELIYRLIRDKVGLKEKTEKRVWIDSQTEEEIKRGISQAKDLSYYDPLANASYLRQIEDYLMGINFSRVMTLSFGKKIGRILNKDRVVIAVGRVMTCILGMVVKREREIRDFKPEVFFKLSCNTDRNESEDGVFSWRNSENGLFADSGKIYKDNGFKNIGDVTDLISNIVKAAPQKEGEPLDTAEESATHEFCVFDGIEDKFLKEQACSIQKAIAEINNAAAQKTIEAKVLKNEKKTEKVNPPLLYNLAELQNECSKTYKISPDETLKIVQDLYEKKLTTYPRTDARVLSSAVCKEIGKNIKGLTALSGLGLYAKEIFESASYKNLAKSRYCDDKKITDHYAIIPTGFGLGALKSLSKLSASVYMLICKRFLSIFLPPAVYKKSNLILTVKSSENTSEEFTYTFKTLEQKGYLELFDRGDESDLKLKQKEEILKSIAGLKKNDTMKIPAMYIKTGETSPPKRYSSGSIILAMENAGKFIEDEELRSHIKGSGIGTSATRAGILEKLTRIEYIKINKKTQIITPTEMGEAIYNAVFAAIPQLLRPDLTASWEKGLSLVESSEITPSHYMDKLTDFVRRQTELVKKYTRI